MADSRPESRPAKSTLPASRLPFPRGRRLLLVLATAFVCVGGLIHLTVNDRFAVFAPLAYAAPYPLVLVAGLALAVLHGYRRALKTAGLCLALALLAGWHWWGLWGTPVADPPPGPTCKLLFWNAAYPKHPSPALLDAVQAEGPDLVVLAETRPPAAEAEADYRRELPGYELTSLQAQLLVLSRRPVHVRETRRLAGRAAIHVLTCETSIGPFTLVLTDIGSNPLRDRKPTVRAVLDAAASDTDIVIAGDFNTPYDSVAFDPFRERFAHALKDAGSGPIETWPSVGPVLAIDHVWLSRAFAPVAGRKRWTGASDHALVVAEFARR